MADNDPLLKELVCTFFADFLRLVAPELRAASWSFLDKELLSDWPERRRREPDLLARVVEGPGSALLVHVEIESCHRGTMPERLWRYHHLLKGRFAEAVVSILINLKGGPPGLSQRTIEERASFQLRTFQYTVLGLSGSSPHELLDRAEPLAWAFASLTRHRKLRRAALKLECLKRVERAAIGLSEYERFLLVNCIETYLQLTPEENVELEALGPSEPIREVTTMQVTWADRMRAEGREQGILQGLEKGREQGREQGREEVARSLLLHQLQQRFGRLSAKVERQLGAIRSVDRLVELAQKVLVVKSVEELGLG